MTPRTTEQTAAIFDQWAERYDTDLQAGSVQMGPLAGYASSLDLAGRVVARRVGSNARLLDIGVGTGAFADQVIRQHPTGDTLIVSGIDPSDGMRRRLAQSHPAFIVEPGDFLTIPLQAGGWDAIISSFALHEVDPAQRAVALDRTIAALRPGGVLALLDIMFASPAALAEAEATANGWDPTETYHLVGDLDAQLREAGLAGIHWWQTAPMHWLVTGHRGNTGPSPSSPVGATSD